MPQMCNLKQDVKPNDINDVDAKEASEDIQFNNQQSRKKEISEAVSKRAMSNKIRYDKRYKQKTSNISLVFSGYIFCIYVFF